ncbi:hypothetical protein FNF27_04544 [Cafeteria roenbergensis]|uniref:Uncharacterized protein n=1 Tax=Cafeteria roenbergensis TaxID=33653 RepID=A0A5A8E827_CAFRO|nr:hypothetical protein FNF29_06182 [Cafeteria roenbergensis]KAA0158703.1 hypothetical protein FNF31_05229 [Cafeteria roenbergensis]KAA0163041.1 hypothetical protein FNF28_04431 [Cafeteria roenbergensis]KAA0173983.1 hypothetical protein FNF27_04544 [Cafeteria roenbergensis]CAE7300976.1 unnamed protein product [Symbiodinium sp. KB8]|eukprot:KAA0149094.1 hypothetical protein FNF29_06182 [Cafeteria roenbergensis]
MAADSTFHLREKLLSHAHELPSAYCLRRFVDVQFLKMDLLNPKSVVARKLSKREQDMVLQERIAMFKSCVVNPGKPSEASFLYNPKEAASMTGGTVERQRAVRG